MMIELTQEAILFAGYVLGRSMNQATHLTVLLCTLLILLNMPDDR